MNWIKMGWGPNLSPDPFDGAQFTLDFIDAEYFETSAWQLAIDVVKNITINYAPPYNLMVSGGVDSQAMLYAWLISKVPFKAISVQYIDDEGVILNSDDLAELETFASAYNIPVEYHTFKIFDFLNRELQHYVHEYQCTSPQICTHMKMSEFIADGTVIFAGNFIYPNNVALDYTILGLHRYAEKTKRPIIPYFFMHDKSLSVAFIKSINTMKIRASVADEYAIKTTAFHRNGFPVIPQKTKMTGFERIKEYYDQFPHLVHIRDRLLFASKPSKRVFDLLFRYHWTKTVKYDDELSILNLPRIN